MRTIHKLLIDTPPGQSFFVSMPQGARVLSVQMQRDTPVFWALLDDDEEQETEEREFVIYATGHDIPKEHRLEYVGTFQIRDGIFVWHLFEIVIKQ